MQLSDHDMAIVRKILGALIPECEVWAFGSRVHGRGLKKFSDIDLAVIDETPIATALMGELKEAFVESDLPYRVDVVDYASASKTFRNIIMQEYEIIQQQKSLSGLASRA